MVIKQLFQFAEKKKIAVGHFNVSNTETFEAAVLASKRTKTPIIIATSEGAIAHSGLDFFISAKEYYEKKYNIELFLHLDHGRDLDLIEKAIKKGYDSVMIDASHYDFEKNINLTRYITKRAHRYGVAVEAELGIIGGAEENIKSRGIKFTNPFDAQEFVNKTNCDMLAVAIGTSHGVYKFLKKSELNFDLLERLNKYIDIPLVLHGASAVRKEIVSKLKKYGVKLEKARGVDDRDIKKAIKLGIRKVNIDTDLQLSMILALHRQLKENSQEIKLYKILEKVKEAMEEEVVNKIRLFSGR